SPRLVLFRSDFHGPHCLCLQVVPLCAIQHPQNQAVPNPVCHPAAGANLGEFPPSLLQRPPNWPAGLRGETTRDDPEHGSAHKSPRYSLSSTGCRALVSLSSSRLCLPTECFLVLLPPT